MKHFQLDCLTTDVYSGNTFNHSVTLSVHFLIEINFHRQTHLLSDLPHPISYNTSSTGADLDSTPVLNSVVHVEKVTSLVNHLWQTKAIANDDSYALAA